LSMAISIVEGAEEEASRHGNAMVEVVHLRLGQLSGVVKEALVFSYALACEGTAMEGSTLEIEEVPTAIFCRECGDERETGSVHDFRCPVCLTPSAEIVRGRELMIVGLELQQEYANAIG